jgi:hypothetical protein
VRKLLLTCLLTLLASCDQAERPELYGRLYFVSGNYVGEFDLAQGTSVAVANRGAVTIRDISAFDAGRLLLVETASVESREVPRISWINPKSGRAETLYSGVSARYLPEPAALVWDDGSRLHVTSRRADSSINAQVVSHSLNQLSTIIDVSDHMVLFEAGTPENRTIHSYDIETRELANLETLSGICRLAGAVWIDNRDQLACLSREHSESGSDYLLVDLAGIVRGQLALPEKKDFVALAFAADQQTLVLAEHWTSFIGGADRYAVWAYNFIDGQSYRIVRNQYLGDSAVYVDE